MTDTTGSLMNAISADIHLLGNLLGQVISDQHGDEALALVERIRHLAKDRRGGQDSAAQAMIDLIGTLDPARLRILIKAFSNYFQLINIAEDQQRIRVLRQREGTGSLRESIHAAIGDMHAAGLSEDDLRGVLDRLRVRLVLTAHPSEAKRKEVLIKLRAIARMMVQREQWAMLPHEMQALSLALTEEVEELWQTRPTRAASPTVADEVDFGLYFLTSVIMDVAVDVHEDLRRSLQAHYPQANWDTLPPLLRYASWIGADRDGNPNVTPGVTLDTIKTLHRAAQAVYLTDVAFLRDHLTQSVDEVDVSEALRASLPDDKALRRRYPGEIYRQKLDVIYHDLKKDRYRTGDDLLADLDLVAESLRQNRGHYVAGGALQRLIEKVRLFGLHLVPLEVRQDARLHTATLAALFAHYGECADYLALPEAEKQALLVHEIKSRRPLFPEEPAFTPEINDVIATWRMITKAHRRHGPDVIDTVIASHTEQPSDILTLLLMASEVGVQDNLDLVPLFETVPDLEAAPQVMQTLFAEPVYRQHLAARNDRQQIMIGYSDSNKDGGYFASNWHLHVAQERLAALCESEGVLLELFHGRGGSIGRGGGPANRAILSQPAAAIRGPIKITEQGEVVAYRYGNAGIARRHLHQVMHATLLATVDLTETEVQPEWIAAMDALSAAGRDAYRTLVYETPGFLDYWQQATPILQLARLPIGSRPVKRSQGGFDAIRAIPWVFSWMQSRAIIPSWYGVGHALEAYCQRHPDCLDVLRTMYHAWPFFTVLIENLELDVAKADMGIAALYADLVEDAALREHIFGQIRAEHDRAHHYIRQITGQAQLLDNAAVIQHSIERRNPYVDPLNFIQVTLLRRLRELDAASPEYDTLADLVLATVNGIAAGMKTTG